MHKLGKGLKKKIKGKKGKEKEEDLALEREVKLRREKAEAAALAAAAEAATAEANGEICCEEEGEGDDCETGGAQGATATEESTGQKKAESEEWAKFKLLTSGTSYKSLGLIFALNNRNNVRVPFGS